MATPGGMKHDQPFPAVQMGGGMELRQRSGKQLVKVVTGDGVGFRNCELQEDSHKDYEHPYRNGSGIFNYRLIDRH